jgi:hypothetical protein
MKLTIQFILELRPRMTELLAYLQFTFRIMAWRFIKYRKSVPFSVPNPYFGKIKQAYVVPCLSRCLCIPYNNFSMYELPV